MRLPRLEKQMVVYAREASVLSFSVTTCVLCSIFPFLKAESSSRMWNPKFYEKRRASSSALTATFCQTNPHRARKKSQWYVLLVPRVLFLLSHRFGLRSKPARRGVASVRVDAFVSLFFLLARFREIFVPVVCGVVRLRENADRKGRREGCADGVIA